MSEARKAFEEEVRRNRACLEKHLDAGVNFISFDGVVIEDSVAVAPGATILPGTILRGKTVIGAGCVIGPNSVLENAELGERVEFNQSQGYDCRLADGVRVGPFAHLRPNTVADSGVHLGAFVETKNSTIGKNTQLSHLTYVGDSDVGKGCNFGCGTVTSNYDGVSKNRCKVGDYVFIGCNTNLIAPVTVGDGAYTAAGSTITGDVPAGALAIARERQTNKEGWAETKLAPYYEKQKKKEN